LRQPGDNLLKAPPSADELNRAKEAILNSFIFEFDSKQKVMAQKALYEFYGYPPDFLERYRAGIEKVLGFCTPEEHRRFLRQCPTVERLLVEDGITLLKYWFSVSDEEQERRFRARIDDPIRRWKLSDTDLFSRSKWVDYSRAKDEMFVHTDIPEAPWYLVEADDKPSARLNCIAHLLSKIPYEQVQHERLDVPDRQSDEGYVRPPREAFTYVPDHAARLVD